MTAVTALGPAERPHRGSTHLEESRTFWVAETRGVCRLFRPSPGCIPRSLPSFSFCVLWMRWTARKLLSAPLLAGLSRGSGEESSLAHSVPSILPAAPLHSSLPLSFCGFTLIRDRSRYPNCEPSCLRCCRFQSSRVTVVLFTAAEAAEHNSTNNPEMHQNPNCSHQRDFDVKHRLLKSLSIHAGPCTFILLYL